MPDEQQGLHVPSSFDGAPIGAQESGYDIPAPDEQPPEPEEEMWSTVFVIGVDKSGVAFAAENVEEFLAQKRFDHMATPPEMLAAVRQVKGDIEASQVASQVMRGMQMMGQMMAQQAEAQKIVQGAGLAGMPMNREQRRRQG